MGLGLLASLLSAALSSSKDLLSKRLASRLDGTLSTFASFAYALPFYLAVLAGLLLFGQETLTLSFTLLLLVFLRSVTDTMAEWMKMYAFAHGDISMVATIFSMAPLFLLVTSPLITGDQLSWQVVIAMILVVCGSLLLVNRPTASGWKGQHKGMLLALGASVFFSLNSCFDRLAVRNDPAEAAASTGSLLKPVFAGFAMTLLSAIFLLPFVVRRHQAWQSLREQQGGLWLRGLLEVTFMVSKLYALQTLQAPEVAGIQRLSLVFSIIGGRVFFKEQNFGRRLIAGIIIVGGTILIAWLRLRTLNPGE